MLFSQEHRPSAKDLWYQGDNKNAVTLECKFMVQEGWNTSLPVFAAVPEEVSVVPIEMLARCTYYPYTKYSLTQYTDRTA